MAAAVAAPSSVPDASLMSNLAQSFVEQTAFPRDAAAVPPAAQVRARPPPAAAADPVTPSRSPGRAAQRISGTPQKKGNVFSWTNDMLAEHFHFVKEIGFGNWGSVWMVRQKRDLTCTVQSVKLVHRSDESTSAIRMRALWTEFECIRLMNKKPHPNIIRFHSHITTPTYSLCTMDYHSRLMPISLDETKSRPYFLQLLSAVAHLHANGITHSDLKPANILLSADDRPILIDFGFAQHYDVTQPEAFLSSLSWGTPEYLSPERAKGAWHDERLSDVFALGVTMYEIVVGRTPFEQSENEAFLNREALEVYYRRTLTGKFYGPFQLSEPLQDLLVSMIQPDPRHRMSSCALAMRHRFFSPRATAAPPSPQAPHSSARRDSRKVVAPSVSETHVVHPSAGSPQVSTPRRRTPKKVLNGASFAVFEDATKTDAPSTPTSSFTPRRLALMERTNRTPQSETRTAAAKPISLAKFAKSPPPSRIPVRKAAISSPFHQSASHTVATRQTLFTSRIASPPRALGGTPAHPVRSRLVSQPVSSQNATRKVASTASRISDDLELENTKVATGANERDAAPLHAVSQSRSPPIVGDLSRTVSHAPASSTSTEPFPIGEATSAIESDVSESSPASEGSPDFVVRTRTYTVALKASKGGKDSLAGSFLSDIPKLTRSSSRVLSNGLKKLSSKHGRKLSEARSRRHASLSDTTFEIIEAERIADRESHTMPITFEQPSGRKAMVARARLVSLTRRSEDLIRPALKADPFLIAPSGIGEGPRDLRVSGPSERSIATSSLEPVPFASTEIDPPSLHATERLADVAKLDDDRERAQDFSASQTQSTREKPYRPGHRRIPTAIRNTPSVLVYESVDDGDCSTSDFSRCETPASPPPAPRIVAEARQLPTWVPEQSDSDSDAEADVDEPTLKLGSPTSRTLNLGSAQSLSRFSEEVESAFAELSEVRPTVAKGSTTAARPPSTFSALPFTNLHQRSDSASTFNTLASSKHEPARLHKRSRSVLSFFSLLSPSPALDSTSSLTTSRTSTSRPSESSYAESCALGDGDVTIKLTHAEPVSTKGKKGGKFRKAVKRLFK